MGVASSARIAAAPAGVAKDDGPNFIVSAAEVGVRSSGEFCLPTELGVRNGTSAKGLLLEPRTKRIETVFGYGRLHLAKRLVKTTLALRVYQNFAGGVPTLRH